MSETKDIRQRAEEALKRAEAATPGPWDFDTFGATAIVTAPGPLSVAEIDSDLDGEDEARSEVRAQAKFIAHARADVPDFAAALLRLTGPKMRAALVGPVLEWCAVPMSRCNPTRPCQRCEGLILDLANMIEKVANV